MTQLAHAPRAPRPAEAAFSMCGSHTHGHTRCSLLYTYTVLYIQVTRDQISVYAAAPAGYTCTHSSFSCSRVSLSAFGRASAGPCAGRSIGSTFSKSRSRVERSTVNIALSHASTCGMYAFAKGPTVYRPDAWASTRHIGTPTGIAPRPPPPLPSIHPRCSIGGFGELNAVACPDLGQGGVSVKAAPAWVSQLRPRLP